MQMDKQSNITFPGTKALILLFRITECFRVTTPLPYCCQNMQLKCSSQKLLLKWVSLTQNDSLLNINTEGPAFFFVRGHIWTYPLLSVFKHTMLISYLEQDFMNISFKILIQTSNTALTLYKLPSFHGSLFIDIIS